MYCPHPNPTQFIILKKEKKKKTQIYGPHLYNNKTTDFDDDTVTIRFQTQKSHWFYVIFFGWNRTEQNPFLHLKRHVEYDIIKLKKKTHYKISLPKTTCVLILMSEPIPLLTISLCCCGIVSIPNALFFIFRTLRFDFSLSTSKIKINRHIFPIPLPTCSLIVPCFF